MPKGLSDERHAQINRMIEAKATRRPPAINRTELNKKIEALNAEIVVPQYDPHELLTIDDVCHLFGLSRATIERMRRKRTVYQDGEWVEIPPQIHGIKLHRSIRFPRTEIHRLIEQRKLEWAERERIKEELERDGKL